MEQYCCRDHQKEDWKVNKEFCLANRCASGGDHDG
jgi:hypothetical protein